MDLVKSAVFSFSAMWQEWHSLSLSLGVSLVVCHAIFIAALFVRFFRSVPFKMNIEQ